MMSLTFGLFTQVSGSGPLGPLVWFSICGYVRSYVWLFCCFTSKVMSGRSVSLTTLFLGRRRPYVRPICVYMYVHML